MLKEVNEFFFFRISLSRFGYKIVSGIRVRQYPEFFMQLKWRIFCGSLCLYIYRVKSKEKSEPETQRGMILYLTVNCESLLGRKIVIEYVYFQQDPIRARFRIKRIYKNYCLLFAFYNEFIATDLSIEYLCIRYLKDL